MKKLFAFSVFLIFVVFISGCVQEPDIEKIKNDLDAAGFKDVNVSAKQATLVVEYQQMIDEIKTESEIFEKYAEIANVVSNTAPAVDFVKVRYIFDDGQIFEISGALEKVLAFLDNQTSEDEFLESLTVKSLTRGHIITGGICEHAKGENCENTLLDCACYPNEKCNPLGAKANKKGCVVKTAPLHAYLIGEEYVCEDGYEWNNDLTDCVLEKICPPGSFRFQDECFAEGEGAAA